MAVKLGELESAVLEVLWKSSEPLSVREVVARIRRRLAYTTVLTVLDRLHDKGMVMRCKEGKAFLYRPRLSREAWLGEQAAQTLTRGRGADEAVLLAFLDSTERVDPSLVERLSALIASRRRKKR